MNCIVYWLYDDQCICVWKHGYVGITSQWERRLRKHRNKGELPRDFKFKFLFQGTRKECLRVEAELRPDYFIGWNILRGGQTSGIPGSTNKSRTGMPHSEETRRKISLAHTGMKQSKEFSQKISLLKIGNKNRLGKFHSEQTKQQIRLKKIGIPVHSEETKQKRRERFAEMNRQNKGKPWTAARRQAQLARQQRKD